MRRKRLPLLFLLLLALFIHSLQCMLLVGDAYVSPGGSLPNYRKALPSSVLNFTLFKDGGLIMGNSKDPLSPQNLQVRRRIIGDHYDDLEIFPKPLTTQILPLQVTHDYGEVTWASYGEKGATIGMINGVCFDVIPERPSVDEDLTSSIPRSHRITYRFSLDPSSNFNRMLIPISTIPAQITADKPPLLVLPIEQNHGNIKGSIVLDWEELYDDPNVLMFMRSHLVPKFPCDIAVGQVLGFFNSDLTFYLRRDSPVHVSLLAIRSPHFRCITAHIPCALDCYKENPTVETASNPKPTLSEECSEESSSSLLQTWSEFKDFWASLSTFTRIVTASSLVSILLIILFIYSFRSQVAAAEDAAAMHQAPKRSALTEVRQRIRQRTLAVARKK